MDFHADWITYPGWIIYVVKKNTTSHEDTFQCQIGPLEMGTSNTRRHFDVRRKNGLWSDKRKQTLMESVIVRRPQLLKRKENLSGFE